MPRALFNGTVIAESDSYESVEGNVYFPPAAIKSEYFVPTERTTVCGWKGTARYFSVSVAGEVAENAAWTYPEPKPDAEHIRGYVAFYPAVTVEL